MSGEFDFLERNQTCGIRLTAKLPWSPRSSVYLSFTRPHIEIDDDRRVGRWGQQFFDVGPGPHVVVVSFPYLFIPGCGRARLRIDLGEGQVAVLEYHTPWVLFAPGDLRHVRTDGGVVNPTLTPAPAVPQPLGEPDGPNTASTSTGAEVVRCPYCGIRVAVTSGGQCPSCRRSFAE